MGSQLLSLNVKNFPRFELQIWPEIITSRDAESTCFKGSRTSCDVIFFWHFLAKFWLEKITSRDGCLLQIPESSTRLLPALVLNFGEISALQYCTGNFLGSEFREIILLNPSWGVPLCFFRIRGQLKASYDLLSLSTATTRQACHMPLSTHCQNHSCLMLGRDCLRGLFSERCPHPSSVRCHNPGPFLVIFFSPYNPPPPSRQTPPSCPTREGLISVHFGSVWLHFGSVWLRSGPFRLRFGSVSGPLSGVGVGSGRGASVREKNITSLFV